MRTRTRFPHRIVALTLLSLTATLATLTAPPRRSAQATWPPPADVTRDQIRLRENWPNDPDYGPHMNSSGRMVGGQWEHWSWVPTENQMVTGFRTPENAIGAGNNVDRAWGLSIGDPRVLIAVLDCGIQWEHPDLVTQAALNRNELPPPQDAMGATLAYDANGDGVLNILDYMRDPRVTCGASPATRDRLNCVGSDGMPNDPNRNRVLDAGDLIRTFSNGMDEDDNGYVDDISGWDFHMDDNDPFDDTRYGHGTGEARDSTAAGNNGTGGIGGCPNCQFVPLRVGDSFITDVNDFAQAVVYATDLRYGSGTFQNRVRVIQEALGTVNQSEYSLRAIDYAYRNGLLVVASAADENSRHHNMPGTTDHVMYVHAVRYDGAEVQSSRSFLAFNNCTNYGGQLQLSVSGTGCSSEATGQSSGHAGLLFSYAQQRNMDPPLNAEEARQLFVMNVDDISIPESIPGHPMYNNTIYPSLPGWEQRFGYGRPNVRRMLEAIRDGRIPPEVDITSPRWFTVLHADRDSGRRLRLEGTIAARRARAFDYTIEWARGIEPRDTDWQMIRQERNVTAPLTNMLADLDVSAIQIDNPGEIENRYTITVRIRATAHYDGMAGDVPGEVRRVYAIHRDPTLLPGYPIETRSSGESSSHMADLNGDGRMEVVIATSDGLVHALQADGRELAGFPVRTGGVQGLDGTRMPSYLRGTAYRGPMPAIDPALARESVLASPGIADLDNDGNLEIVIATFAGTIHVWNHDGTPYGHGFPITLPTVRSADTAPNRHLARGIFGSPVLFDLDRDMNREIIVGGFDGNVYAFRSQDAARQPGYPVLIHFPEMNAEHNRVFGPVGVGNFDGDSIPDLVVVSNERLPGNNNTGAVYIVHGDGMNHTGGPYHPNWPVALTSFDFFPMVGEGVSTSPAIADVDGDGLDDLSLTGTGLPTIVIARGRQSAHARLPEPALLNNVSVVHTEQRGPNANTQSRIVAFANAFSLPSFGDLTNDGVPDFIIHGASLDLAINLGGGARRVPFEHLTGAWDGRTGNALPGFPRVIEDYTFFMNATIADVSGDPYAEILVGTGGYYLRAFDACGREAAGFPKFTGSWIIPAPTVGDMDGDGTLEVTTGTRNGFIYAWHTQGRTTGSVQWPTNRHDNANTGNYGTALPFGTRRVMNAEPVSCPVPSRPDAGVADTGSGDAAGDGGMTNFRGGCGCRIEHAAATDRWLLALFAVAAGVVLGRRRRRCRL